MMPPLPTCRRAHLAHPPPRATANRRMDEVCGQSKLFARSGESVRLPVAHMVCNQTPPVGGKPSLMTFREVETLFHEFGHAAQHMLTEQQVRGGRVLHCDKWVQGMLLLSLGAARPPGCPPAVCLPIAQPSRAPAACTQMRSLTRSQIFLAPQEGLVAGIRGVEWDAVELPSQFMENWCCEWRC